ncbi:DUF2939 domain-containing protein [Halochromatium salexigens]|uniref:DUF2939 domain-containing protein n=1 Tax=Halochromatium salexigens TaxID=49447 RepID=A0AAJ0XG14_HALSE|nr:DUF2939 domain-containing protein [Halochromatium salexigens]MBK5931604.1 hypothetical protein [Halochromatium salexigens]
MPVNSQAPLRQVLSHRRPWLLARTRWVAAGLLIIASLYLVSPFISLWRLDRTTVNGPTSALSSLIDIEAVRDQILRRLDKDRQSAIGEVSDAFIDWVQTTIRREGLNALPQGMTLAWVRERLLTHAEGQSGFWPAISYAFYDSPTSFRVRIGQPAAEETSTTPAPPVRLRLERGWLDWRVTAISY